MSIRPPTWLWALPVFSCGLLSFVLPLVIAAKLKQSRACRLAGGLTVAWFLGFALVASQPGDADNIWSTSGVFRVAWVGGVGYIIVLGPRVDLVSPDVTDGAPSYDPNSAAIPEKSRRDGGSGRRHDSWLGGTHRWPATFGSVVRTCAAVRRRRPGRCRQRLGRDDAGVARLIPAQAAQVVQVRQQLTRFEQTEDLSGPWPAWSHPRTTR